MLSLFLFSLYTADCGSSHEACPTEKLADDRGLKGLITNDNDSHHQQKVDRFVDWCKKNYLVLNVWKTQEMVIDFRQKEIKLRTNRDQARSC